MRVLLTFLFECFRTPWHQASEGLFTSVHADVVLEGVSRLAAAVAIRAGEARIEGATLGSVPVMDLDGERVHMDVGELS